MFESFLKPSLSFPTLTGSIVKFNSQYAGLPLKSHKVNIDSVSGVSEIIIGNCDSKTAELWTIDNSFNGDVEFNQLSNNTTDNTVSNSTFLVQQFNAITGHKYMFGIEQKDTQTSNERNTMMCSWNNGSRTYELTNVNANLTKGVRKWVSICPSSGNANFYYWCKNSNVDTTFTNYQLFDLTQMFGSTIADYIYNLEQTTAGAGVAFFKHMYPDNYYPYNAGTKQGVGNSTTISIGSTVNEATYNARTGVLEVTQPSVQTLHLPPCPIDTLEGVNNIWADTGDTTLQYPKFG